MWQKCIKRARSAQRIMTYVTMQLCNSSLHILYMDNAEEYWITVRGATKWDGARGKKQVWRPHFRTWGLPKANVLHWSSCDIVRTSRRPTVIRRLHSDSTHVKLCPLPPVVTPLITARSDAPQQIMVHSSNQRHTGTFSIRPNFCATLRKNE